MRVFEKCHQGVAKQEGGRSGGKIKWKLSEVNSGAVSRAQDELIAKFKMATSDVISIRGQFMEYMNIPTGIKKEFLRFCMDCDWKV